LWGQWERFKEAWEYLKVIHSVDVPVHFGQTIVAAHGEQFLREVTIAELDAEWRPISGTKRRLAADVACIGFGFIPSTQLSRLCGCKHAYQAEAGGWVVAHDESQRTSNPDVFVAGESTGISGGDVAMAQGTIAGIFAARDLGAISEAEALRRAAPYRQRLQQLQPFVRTVRALFSLRCGLLDLITDDTTICRCEEITADSIRSAIRKGADNVNAVKARTRAGMGMCQGRICERIVAEMVARETGQPVEAVGAFTARPIIKPVSLAEIAKMSDVKRDA
jgi:NAD(P)H-nitrite reductase large subunit